jgi:hypothetical protein
MTGSTLTMQDIEDAIFLVRGLRVMLDADLARLYAVETKNLNKAVRRNLARFPGDFMFRLTEKEAANLRFQCGTSSFHGGRRYLPFAFTQEGVAMLSSVLTGTRAIAVNVEIMRVFVRLRHVLASNDSIAKRLDEFERQVGIRFASHEQDFRDVFEAIRRLIRAGEDDDPPSKIGFDTSAKAKAKD